MIRFKCPSCNALLRINDSLAGRKCACPKCGQRLDVPTPADPLPAPVVEEASSKATKPKVSKRYLLVASLVVGALLALGSVWFFFLREPRSRVLAGPNASRFVPAAPQNPVGFSRQLPVASNLKQAVRAPIVAKKAATTQGEPALQRNGDEYKLAMGKLAEFQRASDDATRSRIAAELAEMSEKLTTDECSQVVEAVAKLGTSGKPLARLLCAIIGNQPYPLHKSPVVRSALEALERVHPQLFQPVFVITIGESPGYSYDKDIKHLIKLGDSAVLPILLNHAKAWAANHPYGGRNFNLHTAMAAVRIMGGLGPKAKEAIPILRELRFDENGPMRGVASEALKQIDSPNHE